MRKLLIVIFVLAAVGISAGAYYMRRNGGETRVVTAPISRGDVVDTVGATGTLEAVTTVQVGSQVSGTVQELYADFNSIVKKGQVVARLDPSLLQTQIDQARANLVRAEADVERLRVALDDAKTKLERAKGLAARSLIPASELDAADVAVRSNQAQLRSSQAQVTQARANLNQTQVNLRHTVIHTPIDGIVIARNVDVGQTVAASLQAPTLFSIAADLTKMKVNASIDEADVGRIRPGQAVRFRVDAYPNDEFGGAVAQIRLQPVVVQNVVTYSTVIDVPNPELKLKPGMTANVTIEIARRSNVLRVPNPALRFRPTNEIFAALGQAVPPEMQRPAGRGGPGGVAGAGPTAAAPTVGGAATPKSTAPPPTASSGPSAEQRQASPPQSAGSAPGEGGRGRFGMAPGGPGGGGFDPERRRQFMERMQNMSPEERERFMQRMRERRGGGDGGEERQPERSPSAPRNAPGSSTRGGAQTIDALFGPLPATVSAGRVWLYANSQLKPIRVRLGISDGTNTELLSEDLREGAELVTNVITEQQPRATGGATGRSPLMGPQRGPGGGMGARPGGGGGQR